MAKDERNAYTIQNDAKSLVSIADEVVAIIARLLRKWMALLPWPEILRMK